VSQESLRLGLCAGEASGDLLAGSILRAWQQRGTTLDITGIGGDQMHAAGLESLCAIDRLAVMGLVEPLKRLPELLGIRGRLIAQQQRVAPDLFVGVDSPDFNLLVERRLRASGIPTAHLVSPSVWAWRRGRLRGIRESVDRMLCLLPFEVDIYREAGIDAVCVGHPLVDELQQLPTADELRTAMTLPSGKTLLAVLPGSREGEVRHLMPVFADAMQLLQARHTDLHFVIPAANAARHQQIESVLQSKSLSVSLIRGQGREVMRCSDAIMIASGTATLEAMLLRKPMVISYRMASLSWAILSRLVKTPYVGLPNVLAGDEVVPELLQHHATASQLADAVSGLLEGDGDRQVHRFDELAGLIGGNFAERSIDALLPLVEGR
jgi:lipid-A-disaccharide synthase